jgi:Right handed beta helix region
MRSFSRFPVFATRGGCAPATLASACGMLLALASIATATTYEVGPGRSYATPSDVPWESLAAGDSVLIHARPAPYRDKWVICRVGTAGAPIVVRGIPDAGGALPVIDGDDAVTRTALNFWNENRGVIKIGGANNPPDTMPAWIIVESLDIRGARPENTFTGRNGLTAYANNAASIYIEKGQNVVVRGCHLHGCSNGFFCASQTTNLLVEANWIEDNGNVGSIFEHNNYTEGLGIVFQFNHFGPLRAGASGNNLKDRSAGTIVRYNWIESGNRQLDLVESDFDELVNDPSYRETFVYGNILIEPDGAGNSQIAHYGGDGGDPSRYRHGTLYFHNNTLVSRRAGNTTLLRLSTDGDSADVRNNILFVTATGSRLAMLDQDGYLVATQNWMKAGWVASHSGGPVNLVDNGQVTGTVPGFIDLATDDFELAASSPCIDVAAVLHPAVLPEHRPVLEYVRHQMNRPRVDDGDLDIGAYELGAAVGVGPWAGAASTSGIRVLRNPFSAECEVRVLDPRDARAPSLVEVIDASGRLVAHCAEIEPGRWIWRPDARTSPGLYVIRQGDRSVRATYVR